MTTIEIINLVIKVLYIGVSVFFLIKILGVLYLIMFDK